MNNTAFRRFVPKVVLVSAVLTLLLVTVSDSKSSDTIPLNGPAVWYVAITGSDSVGDGSYANPFRTIQYALDISSGGDEIVVLEGKHTGPGNRNLDFKGKAVTVRSRDPEDEACMRATTIDAEGQGVIVRFVNDEGPASVFEGFTLVAGDTSLMVRGAPGFFEFSSHARPSTRRLRVIGDDTMPTVSPALYPLAGAPDNWEEYWDGMNPFHQPLATTDYYGSGDVDMDREVTAKDVLQAQEMANGLRASNARADVDGSGVVDANDVSLISAALSGSILPAWWNDLPGRSERNDWIDRLMEIDQTDKHPYQYWFVCVKFALQTFFHANHSPYDLARSVYDGGQTIFNVPMYAPSVSGSIGHRINGIVVGDDPLNFDDWRFIEPQTDADVQPGGWNMPYGSSVYIGGAYTMVVEFYVDESGWALVDYNPELIRTRPTPPVQTPDNRPDLWNPLVLPVGEGMLLFERTRDDMSRTTDIHLIDLPFVGQLGTPLIGSSEYSRLLDVFRETGGTSHLLWTGKADYVPGVFYGQLDPATRTVTGITRISTGEREVYMGRVLVTPSGDRHIFWLEGRKHNEDPSLPGVYWTRWTGSGWQAEQNLTPEMDEFLGSYFGTNVRSSLPYHFDVDILDSGEIVLVWTDWKTPPEDSTLHQRNYNGTWGPSIVIMGDYVVGVDLRTDAGGTLHLIYWGPGIQHRTYDGASWSSPVTVDASGSPGYPRMSRGLGETIFLVYEKGVGGQIVPAWSKYDQGVWSAPAVLNVRAGADAWYPTVDLLPPATLVVAWSSRSADLATIEVKKAVLYAPTQIYLPLVFHGLTVVKPTPTPAPPNSPPYTPSSPSPVDGATGQGLEVDLNWSGGDPDGDAVTYDVYLETNDSTPDVLVCNDTTSAFCDPGMLSYHEQYYWQVVATDEHGASTSGPVWDFATPLLVLDQAVSTYDYGFWLNDSFVRWQSFRPALDNLARAEIILSRHGYPGDIMLSILDPGEAVIFSTIIAEEDIPLGSNWLRVDLLTPLTVIPEASYKIQVQALEPSPDPDNRYFWRCQKDSGYDRGESDVEGSWPGTDYSFRTYALSTVGAGAGSGSGSR